MEFKVWVDGIKRVVCGVTDETTCQDIILALAHATGQTGRFTLIEKWRINERFLLPQDNPLKILHKWGEYASDVHFILRKSGKHGAVPKNKEKFKHNFTPPTGAGNIKKSLTFSGAHGHNALHPARNSAANSSFSSTDSFDVRTSTVVPSHMSQGSVDRKDKSPDARRPQASVSPFTSQDQQSTSLRVDTSNKRSRSHDSTVGYGSLERPRSTSPAGLRSPGSGSSVPSPPGTFEHRKSKSRSSRSGQVEQLDLDIHSTTLITEGESFDRRTFEKKIVEHGSLNDLVKLVELQRERIQLLDSQMKIMDSEIQFWEEKDKELTEQKDVLRDEMMKVESAVSQYEVEIKELDQGRWVDKIEAEKQKEQTIKLEISQLETRLAKTEVETTQCQKKIEDLQLEIRAEEVRQDEERKKIEQETLAKITVLKKEIEERISEGELMRKSLDSMEEVVKSKEEQLSEKKERVLDLEKEIKVLNLDMFRKTPLEVITIEEKVDDKSGRKSPRTPVRKLANFQHLTEGVATAKNPHGMWV